MNHKGFSSTFASYFRNKHDASRSYAIKACAGFGPVCQADRTISHTLCSTYRLPNDKGNNNWM